MEILGATLGHTPPTANRATPTHRSIRSKKPLGLVSVEVENVGAEIDLALRFTKRLPHLQSNRLCELVTLLMHDDSGFVDDCLDLRRELQTSVVSAGPMSLGENFVLLLYQISDRIWCCCGLLSIMVPAS